MARRIGKKTITVVRTPKIDRLSDESAESPSEHDVKNCAVIPRISFEEGKGWVVVEGRQIIAPHGSDVTADDMVRVDGVLWNVDGEPGDYENRRGLPKATIFYLTRRSA